MELLPSHNVHYKWGIRLCGFACYEIDRDIDSGSVTERRYNHSTNSIAKRYIRGILYGAQANIEIGYGVHDSTRMNCKEFVEYAEKVLERYGEPGLCYYMLHHYLDKIPKIIRGVCTKLAWAGIDCTSGLTQDKLLDLIDKLMAVEASMLFIIRHWDRLTSSNAELEISEIIHEYSESMPISKLSRGTIREKERVIVAIMRTCFSPITMKKLNKLMPRLKSVHDELLTHIRENLRLILCDIIKDSDYCLRRSCGRVFSVIIECLKCPE